MNQNVFKQMLKEKNLKVTKQRMLVLELMGDHPGEHMTAETIYALAREKDPEIGLATIYRTLQVLVDLEVIRKINFDDRFSRYELGQLPGEEGGGHPHYHHHAICSRCGAVIPFEEDLLDNLEQSLLEQAGFYVVNHEVKLFGYCRSCRKNMEGKV